MSSTIDQGACLSKRRRTTHGEAASSGVEELAKNQVQMMETVATQYGELTTAIRKLETQIKEGIDKKSKVHQHMTSDREFVLTSFFPEMTEYGFKLDFAKTQFGMNWYITMTRVEDQVEVYPVIVDPPEGDLSLEFEYSVRVGASQPSKVSPWRKGLINSTGTEADSFFISWDELETGYFEEDGLHIIIQVKVLKMTGLVKPKLRHFDDGQDNFSNVVLKVENEKFHVMKELLAMQSPYFRAMFFEKFKEAKQDEIPLPDVSAEHFQHFLEALHGDPVIDEFTVEGILALNDVYDSKNVRRLCVEFLERNDEMPFVTKLKLFSRYHMPTLLDDAVKQIRTRYDMAKIVQPNWDEFDMDLMKVLFKHELTLKQ